MEHAPVLLLAYNRPKEFGQTIESLANCSNSKEYDLYINIDAPNIFLDEDPKKQIEIMKTIERYKSSFKSLSVRQHAYHKGLARSVIESVSEIINRYNSIIVIEDDFILSNDCLDFLNDALIYYKNDFKVWSVTAYTPPLKKLNRYKGDAYMTYRPCSWTWGTWADRWNDVDWEVMDYPDLCSDYKKQQAFTRGGYDMPHMLRLQMSGLIDSWAIRWAYAASKKNMMSVYPALNRVWNIGIGNGTHVEYDFPQMEVLAEYPEWQFSSNVDKEYMWREFRNHSEGSYKEWRKEYVAGRFQPIDKYRAMFFAMYRWNKLLLGGHNLADYFINRGYKRIAIYGRGQIGELLKSELIGTGVEFSHFIDKDKRKNEKNICYDPADQMPECDCVVFTVIDNINTIKETYRDTIICNTIKSIIDVVSDR